MELYKVTLVGMNMDDKLENEEIEKEEYNEENGRTSRAPYFVLGLCSGLFVSVIFMVAFFFIMHLNISANGKVQIEGKQEQFLTADVEKKIEQINTFIEKYYLDEPDKEKVVDGIYKGMVAGLGDKYSSYFNKEELKKLLESNKGSFYGVGLSLTQDLDTMYISVVSVMKDTPADGSGIEPGDMIYAVDDEVITGQELSEVVLKVKGELGTKVKLTMYRDGEYMDYEFERGEVHYETVKFDVLDDEIGYITVTQFEQVTLDQFKKALKESEEKEVKGLIIDLRGNPGGDFETVIRMADLLLPKGLIVYTEDKMGARSEHMSDDENQYTKPLVVLVDQGSASASEILSGAIKDYGIGTLVGTKTYGKGIVQRIISLGDGTAMKLTISNYYTPNGNNIHKVGIEPDVEIEFDRDKYMDEGIDNQLEKAKEVLLEKIK